MADEKVNEVVCPICNFSYYYYDDPVHGLYGNVDKVCGNQSDGGPPCPGRLVRAEQEEEYFTPCCAGMRDALEDPEANAFGTGGFLVLPPGGRIEKCPWCGKPM